MLTIFSVPKPFEGHIGLIQENAIGSWTQLHPDVQVLLLGDESGMRQAAKRLKVRHLSGVRTNEWGTPLADSVFERARDAADFPHMCYVNTDIILMADLLSALEAARRQFQRFLMVGQRWDVEIRHPIQFNNGWQDYLVESLQSSGTLHPPAGSDYFVFAKAQFRRLPAFAIGRAGWDNWMIFSARRNEVPVVDATGSVTVLHQEHDYGHLPGGQPHYRLPESQRNLRLAGGPHTVFTLADANWKFDSRALVRSSPGRRRSIESEMLAKLGPGPIGAAAYAILHPLKSYRRARGVLTGILTTAQPTNLDKESPG